MKKTIIILIAALLLSSCMNQNVHKCQWKQMSYTAPTCFKTGSATYNCLLCEKTRTMEIDRLKHNFVAIEISDSSTVYECTECRSKKTVDGSHTEHDMKLHTRTASSVTFKCVECDVTKEYRGTFMWKRASGHDVYGLKTSSDFIEVNALPGTEGPAGGIIFYDCDADNDIFNNDGLVSSECGWRYLEISKNYLSLESGKPSISSHSSEKFIQGYYRKSESGSNLRVNGSTSYKFANCTVDTLGYGKSNTEKLVKAYGSDGANCYTTNEGIETTDECAALLCNALSVKNNGYTYSDWFLPAAYELRMAFDQLENNDDFLEGVNKEATISTSSEKSESKITLNGTTYKGADVMHNFNSENMKTSSKTRDTELYVLPIRQVSCPKEV